MGKHVPLSQRTAQEIRAQGETYLRMAATARTAVAKRGLEALAVRFTAMADRREATERTVRPTQEMELSNAAY
jgi:hypothetical protein